MSQKEVYLFDVSNNPLRVKGIRVELFDAITCSLLDAQNSDDMNPKWGGPPSNEWGVKLSFTAPHGHPFDIYITDPSYSYPGNLARNLYGGATDRVNLDLLKLPSGGGGQNDKLNSDKPAAISKWLEEGRRWDEHEKAAVRNLIFNYISVISSRVDILPNRRGLRDVAENWEEAMVRLNINPQVLLT